MCIDAAAAEIYDEKKDDAVFHFDISAGKEEA